MLTYKAMYKFLEPGVHAEVLDFPGTITCGETLQEARRLLASALVDMAETALLRGEPSRSPTRHAPIQKPMSKSPSIYC